MDSLASLLPTLLGVAVLLPLASFGLIVLVGPRLGKAGRLAGTVGSGAIMGSLALSLFSLVLWLYYQGAAPPQVEGHHAAAGQMLDADQLAAEGASTPDVKPKQGNTKLGNAEQSVATHGTAEQGFPEHGFPEQGNTDQHSADAATWPVAITLQDAAGAGADHADADAHNTDAHADDAHAHDAHEFHAPAYVAGNWYTLGSAGGLSISIGYYIDALTVCMFCMVGLITTCIHFYAMGYMHEELEDVTDHEVTLDDGSHLHRPGRYHRFFQYLSLFAFSMLGLVIAGNLAMIFIFWELVGACSYFLIGFYFERKSASNAGNKAFIVNRVGDFGMIIGIMALFGALGTMTFGDVDENQNHAIERNERGIFSLARAPENNFELIVPEGFVRAAAADEIALLTDDLGRQGQQADWSPIQLDRKVAEEVDQKLNTWRDADYGYWLFIIAGVGIFCGCVGKSAQFPLHVWLPDAMEGPTPVSALLHSATMVAAGVYLAGRMFPFFAPEVLLVIAYVGGITLLMAATIAITATDIKRVLAYSTVSQLGYMLLSIGMGGWLAGMLHLFTHAFFKSLLFMCSGSVIHAVHTNEMTEMGGLRRKMPITAYTMLIGCMAISGAGIPFLVGLSGYYSKDAILAQGYLFQNTNPAHGFLFFVAAAGAAITAFYMFRLWYLTFAGEPRDAHRYDHAHESPWVMCAPLLILSVLAVGVAWTVPFTNLSLANLLEQARPAAPLGPGHVADNLLLPHEHDSHATEIHVVATGTAFFTALTGFLLATAFYGVRWLNAEDARQQFAPVYRVLRNKYWFDELYTAIFIRPVHFISRIVSTFDRRVIDGVINGSASVVRGISRWNDAVDRFLVDGLVNLMADWIYACGLWLRNFQTGHLRTYVLMIVAGTVALFAFGSWFGALF
jgi:NADH-quinone oxidoreductase subunit L